MGTVFNVTDKKVMLVYNCPSLRGSSIYPTWRKPVETLSMRAWENFSHIHDFSHHHHHEGSNSRRVISLYYLKSFVIQFLNIEYCIFYTINQENTEHFIFGPKPIRERVIISWGRT